VNRIAIVATFKPDADNVATAGDFYRFQTVELTADPYYDVPTTREGVKIFPVKAHLLSHIRGPLAVEGGPSGADRSLTNGVKLPGETDDFLIAIGAQPPESQQIDVLNIFNDGSKADTSGVLTETSLTGFNMGPDLVFPFVTGPLFGEGAESVGGTTLVFPGGISFGKVNFGSQGVPNDSQVSTVEVVNVMLGEGNDLIKVEGTLNPAPHVSAQNAFTFIEGWTASDPNFLAGFGGFNVITLDGFNWKGEGFLVGQDVFAIDPDNGSQTYIGKVIAIEDALAYTLTDIDPDTGLPFRDPNDNSLLILDSSDAGLVAGEFAALAADFGNAIGDVKLVAIDKEVFDVVTVVVTNANLGLATLTRNAGSWKDDGFLEGHLLQIGIGEDRLQYRIVTMSPDGRSMDVEGTGLANGALTEAFWVQGAHGGLTVLHGGGNLYVNVDGKFNIDNAATPDGETRVVRIDGRSFGVETGFKVGQVIQLEGETFTREVLRVDSLTKTDAAAYGVANPFQTWGFESVLVLSDPLAGTAVVYDDVDTADTQEKFLIHQAEAKETIETLSVQIQLERIDGVLETTVTRLGSAGDWGPAYVEGGVLFIEGFAGGFQIKAVTGNKIVLLDAALEHCGDENGFATLRFLTYDVTRSGGQRVGGDHFIVTGGAGPDSPLVIYGDTSQDGVWYSGHSYDRLGLEFGEKPFDPFPKLPDQENEDDEWVFGLANPFKWHGNDVIDASALFADYDGVGGVDAIAATTVSVGITAYGGMGNDLIIGSQTGDHLAGGSGHDTIIGQRGTDHIYGDSGVNVNILTRALTITTLDASPLPSADPDLPRGDSSIDPTASPVRDPMGKRPTDPLVLQSLLNIFGAGDDVIEGNGSGMADGTPDIVFGDHGEVIQFVVDPNLPDPKELFGVPVAGVLLQKIQTTLLDSVLEINSKEPQTGGDDIIFGSEIDDVLIGGAGNDMLDGGKGDDMIFGDNVNLTRMAGPDDIQSDGDLLDDIESLRFQTLAGTLLYSRTDRPLPTGIDPDYAYGPEDQDPLTPEPLHAGNSGILLTDGTPRHYRDPNGPGWWTEYKIDYAEYHTFERDPSQTDVLHLKGVGSFGNDYIAGGAGHDQLFGQLGNDVIQGDGDIDAAVATKGDGTVVGSDGLLNPYGGVIVPTRYVGAARMPEIVGQIDDPVGELKVVASFEAASDGQDYVEGGGGRDVIFGGLGQDDLVGGSSDFFSLFDPNNRPDSDDWITGGAGTQLARNNGFQLLDPTTGAYIQPVYDSAGNQVSYGGDVLTTDVEVSESDVALAYASKHGRDSDAIVGDNGDIIRIVGASHDDVNEPSGTYTGQNYVTFNYDTYGGEKIVVRGIRLLDYMAGGPDTNPGDFSLVDPATTLDTSDDDMRPMFSLDCDPTHGLWARVDIGGHDEVHGETGDDFIYVGGGFDIAFGDADSDDIIGGWGHDWISGGTGIDGILGDDGRIFTSRNTPLTGNQQVYGSTYAEALNGEFKLLSSDPDTRTSQGNVINELIHTPGNVQSELINVADALKKSVDLTPFETIAGAEMAVDVSANPNSHNPIWADDVIFGGLGVDFLHGGSGDDAVSGAEALDESYAPRFNGVGELVGLIRSDFSRPYNPSDILHFGDGDEHWNEPKPVQSRTGEFFLYNEYDPRRVILFNDTSVASDIVWTDSVANYGGALPPISQEGITGGSGKLLQYFLNWNSNEGVSVLGYVAFKPDGQTPIGDQEYRQSDGDDVIFGDLGNDWIVGGTGRDHIYGGFGNDLMNADDVLGTVNPNPPSNSPGQLPLGGTDESTDTHLVYEDRVFGGAGLDILIGNTKGDRLIDWVGEFNSFIVPFAPFGVAAVSRQVPPHLFDFLYGQAFSDGVDVTRNTDTGQSNHNQRYSNVVTMQGGIEGEMGLVTQGDHGYWQDQTGGPTDPQAGNVPGGRRDVLRSSDFNNASMDLFVRDTGNFNVTGGRMQMSAASGQQASAFYNLDAYLPTYYEVRAQLSADKPTTGFKSNAYIIFDYQSDLDFKYAGINISTNKIEMGYRDATGWHQVVQSNKPVQLKPGTQYDVLVAVNGTNVTVQVAGVNWFSYTFAPVLDEMGQAIPLNRGLVGVGTNSGKASVDNFTVQVLPPVFTLDRTQDFAASDATSAFTVENGSWDVVGGNYVVSTMSADGVALSLANLGAELQESSMLELQAQVTSSSLAGIAFDVYAADDYKFVALDVVGDKVVVGHVTPKDGMKIDFSWVRTLDDGTAYTLKLTTNGASVGIYLNGGLVGVYGFNSVLVDGRFGLMSQAPGATFDDFVIRTNDPAFKGGTTTAASLMAESVADHAKGQRVTEAQAEALLDDPLRRLGAVLDVSGLTGVDIRVEDLADRQLGHFTDGVIVIDIDAAGHGWFIDHTPGDDREYQSLDGSLLASNGVAAGRVDLLSVIAHELGHAAGMGHHDAGLMSETLATGTRTVPAATTITALTPVAPQIAPVNGMPPVDALRNEPDIPATLPEAPQINWTYIHTDTPPQILMPTPAKPAAWQSDFVNHLARTEAQRNPNANLRVQINLAPQLSPGLSALHSSV
jgi:Ca2+-binding RTX toxin-like protein